MLHVIGLTSSLPVLYSLLQSLHGFGLVKLSAYNFQFAIIQEVHYKKSIIEVQARFMVRE